MVAEGVACCTDEVGDGEINITRICDSMGSGETNGEFLKKK